MIIQTVKFCIRTIAMFVTPIILLAIGAIMMVYTGAVQVAELQDPSEVPGIFEFLNQAVEQAKHNFTTK